MRLKLIVFFTLQSISAMAFDDTALNGLKKQLGPDPMARLLKAKAGETPNRPTDFEFRAWSSPTNVLVWKPITLDIQATEARSQVKSVLNQAIRRSSNTGAAANAPGSLNAVGAASLLSAVGASLESGGLTTSAKKTSGTFSTNFYALFCGSLKSSLFSTVNQSENLDTFCAPGANPLKNLTFSVTLKQQEDQVALRRPLEALSASSVRWDLYNRRDPRSLWKSDKYKLVQQALNKYAPVALALDQSYGKCSGDAEKLLVAGYGKEGFFDEAAILETFETIYTVYQKCLPTASANQALLSNAILDFRTNLELLQNDAKRTWVVASTYDFVRQSLPSADATATATSVTPAAILRSSTANTAITTATAVVQLPSLSTFGLTWESGQYARFNYKGSINVTAFNNAPSAGGNGLRDYRLSNELEFLLVDNKSSKADGLKFSLAGIFLDLRREPLGQKVQLFGNSVTSPGNMGVVQGKFTIPGGNSGVKIPLSLSYATRTELLPDKEWRAGIGLTFNWRQLFH